MSGLQHPYLEKLAIQNCVPPVLALIFINAFITEQSEPEAAPGERQHSGQTGSARWHHDAWRSGWRQRRDAGDDQRRHERTRSRRCIEGSFIP